MINTTNARIGIIGLGYVGLPLAVEFGKKYPTVGFDINSRRIGELNAGSDITGEVETEDFALAKYLNFTSAVEDLRSCNVYIVTVPTPIDGNHQPDLSPLISASETVGKVIGKGDIVVYESTVYPGATEGDCLPIVEAVSGLAFNSDFFAGYSPERINPGDKTRPLTKIVKVTSGSTPEVAEFLDTLYGSIIEAGTYKASSIRVAEAAKVVENTQRDVNIALINELSIIFSRIGIDTKEVIDAAATKWNFIKLQPGLVGGHCIGVDPYYLVHKSISSGYIPDIIRSAREINDGMPRNISQRFVKAMIERDLHIKNARVVILGYTFKENCPDTRNTKVVDLIEELSSFSMTIDVFDPWVTSDQRRANTNFKFLDELPTVPAYDAAILAVPHREFVANGSAKIRQMLKAGGLFFDMKAAFELSESDLRL